MVASFLADKTLLTSIGDHGKLEVDIAPPVRLLSDSELPADHVVTEITPDMLAEGQTACRRCTVLFCRASSLDAVFQNSNLLIVKLLAGVRLVENLRNIK